MNKFKFLLFFLFVFSLPYNITDKGSQANSIIPATQTKTTEFTSIAIADSYVESENPTENNGGIRTLKAGKNFAGDAYYEAYFRFSFSNKPEGWTKAEISLEMEMNSEPIDLKIFLIEEYWGEYNINWENRPVNGSYITEMQVTHNEHYIIDVSDYIGSSNAISICLSYNESINDYVKITSTESLTYYEEDRPHLIWTVEEEIGFNIKYPKKSDVLDPGIHTIKWDSYSTTGEVEIQLYQGDSFLTTITYSTEDDGDYDWSTSPFDGYGGNAYRIRIIDSNEKLVYEFSEYFTISGSGENMGGSLTLFFIIVAVGFVSLVVLIKLIKKYKN